MNQHPQAKPTPAPAADHDAGRGAQARRRDAGRDDKLLAVVERETELVRAGKVREAMALEQQKTELTRPLCHRDRDHCGSRRNIWRRSRPTCWPRCMRHHETFRAMLQINLTVLATAHAVSEGIVRGVNAEVQRRNMPNTYTAAGQRAAPGPRHITPLAVSRSL